MPYTPTEQTCRICDAVFMPRDWRQSYCLDCSTAPCIDCGGAKDARAPRCRACDTIFQRGRPKGRRAIPPIDTIISEVETIGLQSDKQYAFGYIIGVTFGDGYVGQVTDKIKHRCKDGSITVNTGTSYRPRLSVTEEWFANRFAEHWQIPTGRSVKVWSHTRSSFEKSTLKGARTGYTLTLYVAAPRHAKISRYLHHLKYVCEPSYALQFPVEVLKGFIQGMIDSEGYTSPKYTDIANKNTDLLDALVVMLDRLGIAAKVYNSPSQNVAHLRLSPSFLPPHTTYQ